MAVLYITTHITWYADIEFTYEIEINLQNCVFIFKAHVACTTLYTPI